MTIHNVRLAPYNAIGNGIADDTLALQQAALACQPGDELYIPAGHYRMTSGMTFGLNGALTYVTVRGDGARRSVLHGSGSLQSLIAVYSSYSPIHLQNIGLDGGNVTVACAYTRGNTFFHSVDFWGFNEAYGLLAQGASHVGVSHCNFDHIFTSDTQHLSHGMYFTGDCADVEIEHVNATNLYDCLLVDADILGAERFNIHHCNFKMDWYHLPFVVSGSALQWFDNGLEAQSGSFPTYLGQYTTVRAMRRRVEGTVAYCLGRQLVASAPLDLVSKNLAEGDMVVVGQRVGIIRATKNDSTLVIDEWRDLYTRERVEIPTPGTPFTVYSLILGRLTGQTTDRLTIWFWHDLVGNPVTGQQLQEWGSAVHFEVCCDHPNYAINIESGARYCRIESNVFDGGWADQVSSWADDTFIHANLIINGQDMGITSNGKRGLISNNIIKHQGIGGIWSMGDDNHILGNVIIQTQWTSFIDAYAGDIMLVGTGQQTASNNLCDGRDGIYSRYGIVWASPKARVFNNVVKNHRVAPFQAYQSVAFAELKGNDTSEDVQRPDGPVKHTLGAKPGFYELSGTQYPRNAIVAGLRSTYYEQTPQGALWVKRSAVGSDGWVRTLVEY